MVLENDRMMNEDVELCSVEYEDDTYIYIYEDDKLTMLNVFIHEDDYHGNDDYEFGALVLLPSCFLPYSI